MTEYSAATGRDRFLLAVQKELAEAERREREFNKADREERAAKLGIPTGNGQVEGVSCFKPRRWSSIRPAASATPRPSRQPAR